MNNQSDETIDIIRILMDERCDIQFANIQNKEAHLYLNKLGVLDQLRNELPIEYYLEDYCVTIDKVHIFSQDYYLVIAIPRHPKCKNCKEILMDTSTGLYNRNFWERIKTDIDLYPTTHNFSLIIIDIDNLKAINDAFGHLTGDRVIEIVGQAIKSNIREGRDVGIRYGGDEFIILLSNQSPHVTEKVIERIRKDIDRRALNENLNIKFSSGIAYNKSVADLEEMIKKADESLYREKEIKKAQKQQHSRMYYLIKQIGEVWDELDEKESKGDNLLTSEDILELGKRLDKLIEEYIENL